MPTHPHHRKKKQKNEKVNIVILFYITGKNLVSEETNTYTHTQIHTQKCMHAHKHVHNTQKPVWLRICNTEINHDNETQPTSGCVLVTMTMKHSLHLVAYL